MFRKLIADTTGTSAVEYAIIASVISIAAIGAFLLLGQQTNSQFKKVETEYAKVT